MAFALLPVTLACDVGGSSMSVDFKKLLKYKNIGTTMLLSRLRKMPKLGDTLESRSEVPWKFRNVVLKKDGEDQLHHLCEKCVTQSREWNERLTYVVCLKSKCTDFPMDELVMHLVDVHQHVGSDLGCMFKLVSTGLVASVMR